MSSDFESLSCDEDDSRFSQQQQCRHHRHHRPRRDNTSGSFDALDDLVADQDARLLRCLPMVQDSNHLRPGLHDDDEGDDEAVAYGHRAYGVTGPHQERRPPSASHSLLHRFVLPDGARTRQQQPSAPQSVSVSVKASGEASGKGDDTAAASAVSPSCGSVVRLFTQQRKESPELVHSSRTTSCDTPAAAAVSLLPPSILPATVLAAEEHEAATQPVLSRQVQAQARYRTAADVDGDVEPTSPVLPRPHDSLRSPSQQHPSRTWRATCPPDSGPITPATSHATLTASATTRRSGAGGDDDEEEEEDDGDDEREDSVPATPPTPAAVVAVQSVPSPIPPLVHNAVHDADGFYRTGLLEDSDEDDEEEEEQTGRGEHGDRDSHSGQQMQQQGTSLPVQDRNLSTTSEVPVDARRTPPAAAAAAASQPSLFVSTTSAGVAVGPSAPSTTLRERLTVATVELQRVAAALPHMTTVHVLSLIITILIPINVLCLDVMAFAWIRRCVDGRGREAMGVAPRLEGLGSDLHNATGANTSVTASCAAASSSATATAAAAVMAARGRQMLPFSLFQSPRKCATGASLSATYQAGTLSGSVPSLRSDARSGKHDVTFSTDTHAVSAFCCFVLWLMIPNGALVRLLLLRRCGTMEEKGADVIWASYLYARLRRTAPQLVVLELYVRYACLWAMVHTATLLEQWMPVKINPETPWPLSSSASLASSVKARG